MLTQQLDPDVTARTDEAAALEAPESPRAPHPRTTPVPTPGCVSSSAKSLGGRPTP